MTQEDKELLLIDLCARLPYGVRIKIGRYSGYKIIGVDMSDDKSLKITDTENEKTPKTKVPTYIIKPYLRPMSSMTEEEEKELGSFVAAIMFASRNKNHLFQLTREALLGDFFNKHHFDYRGLIEKGLAIEVTKDNNPYK